MFNEEQVESNTFENNVQRGPNESNDSATTANDDQQDRLDGVRNDFRQTDCDRFRLIPSSVLFREKSYPKFTVILRTSLPIRTETIANDDDDQREDVLSRSQSFRFRSNVLDFVFATPWQLWFLMDKTIDYSSSTTIATTKSPPLKLLDWNVRRFGDLARTGQQFWSNYLDFLRKLSKKDEIWRLDSDDGNEEQKSFSIENLRNLLIFRDRTQPKWEDECNRGGGRWSFDISYRSNYVRSKRNRFETIESNRNQNELNQQKLFLLTNSNRWTQTIVLILSECFGTDLSEQIVGLVLHLKTFRYRISIWCRRNDNLNKIIEIGKRLQKCLNLHYNITYELHENGNTSIDVFHRKPQSKSNNNNTSTSLESIDEIENF
ncbi:hypothetical protein NH340_JMT02096 [Sarcoptes scabiei]|nr:hypothetical protein NH340_JMT02096 [Sarcoptes scabiei]